MRGMHLLLAGLVLAWSAAAGAAEAPREPTASFSGKGRVELAFSPWNDPEAALLKAIDEIEGTEAASGWAFGRM